MINWRKPIIGMALRLSGRPAFKYFRYLRSLEYKTPEELQKLQDERIEKLLLHAYKNVPYYHKILPEAGVIKQDRVLLANFTQIPPLSKEIIRREGANLYSKDHKQRKSYRNSSGGSTGEPVVFLQDKDYQAWGFAARFLYNSWAGKDVGEPELKLWGSERDTLGGAEKLSTRLKRWGFSTLVLNSFLMTDDIMGQYVKKWNSLKPKQVGAYASSILEFSRYVKRSGVDIFRPAAIVCSAETLNEEARASISEVFGCHVLNHYGSREAGPIACDCLKREGLHLFSTNNKLEILDKNLKASAPGEIGDVHITTLNNYSMPLIRYAIGDMAILAKEQQCSCRRGWPLLEKVVGRHIEVFTTRDGRTIPGEFFVHFVGVVYNENCVKKFQVVQTDYSRIVIKVVVLDNQKFNELKDELVSAIKRVMGDECEIEFEFVGDIPPTASGKYLYTFSEVSADELR